MLRTVGMREGEVIESRMLTRQIERAQRKVEAHNFDARKNLLEYDDVANDQRKVIYQQRTEVMSVDDIGDVIRGLRAEVVDGIVATFVPPQSVEEQWDIGGLEAEVERAFGVQVALKEWVAGDASRDNAAIIARLLEAIESVYEAKVQQVGEQTMRHLERAVMLQQLDGHWREHLAAMDYLRQGIYLRAYAQKNPKQEYKREAFELFSTMLDRIKRETVVMLQRLQVRTEEEIEAEQRERQARLQRQMKTLHAAPPALGEGQDAQTPPPVAGEVPPPAAPFVREERKIGRNEPCPCGSGKKYKHCHGALRQAGT
jgi:preprotein translocase subunit SecA